MHDDGQVAPFWAFTTDLGVPMAARIIKKSHTPHPLIEFYDLRYPFVPILTHKEGELKGQFITRYFVSTLMEDAEHLERYGLCLDGGVPGWNVDEESIGNVLGWVEVYLTHRQWLYGEEV